MLCAVMGDRQPMRARRPARPWLRMALLHSTALVAVVVTAAPATAQNFTWQGISQAYNDPANWSPGGGPPISSGQSATFGNTGATPVLFTNINNLSPNSWTFAANSQSYLVGGFPNFFTMGSSTNVNFGLAAASGGGIVNLANNGAAILVAVNIGGIGGVRQSGNSFLALSGNNTYTGVTMIDAGVLTIGFQVTTLTPPFS